MILKAIQMAHSEEKVGAGEKGKGGKGGLLYLIFLADMKASICYHSGNMNELSPSSNQWARRVFYLSAGAVVQFCGEDIEVFVVHVL